MSRLKIGSRIALPCLSQEKKIITSKCSKLLALYDFYLPDILYTSDITIGQASHCSARVNALK